MFSGFQALKGTNHAYFCLWGVVNLTPDSFSDGGQCYAQGQLDLAAVVAHAQRLVAEGAAVLDLGAESTRPGAQPITADTELARLLPAIKAIRAALPEVTLSLDTRRAAVADAVLQTGAVTIINDVSGFQYDAAMPAVVAKHGAGIVIMHSQGTPETMQTQPTYDDVVAEVNAFLLAQTHMALAAGVPPANVMWDVGFGFGKTVAHNAVLLQQLGQFMRHGYPVLAGLSRKSFLAALHAEHTQQPILPPQNRDDLSVTAAVDAFNQGVRHFRVHNVAFHQQALALSGMGTA